MQPVTAVQSEYSLWWRDREDDVIPVLDELDIGLVPYSPLGKGFLTGTIDASTTFPEGDLRASIPRFQQDAMAANLALVEVLNDIAAQAGATSAQVALAWLLANSRGSCRSPAPSDSPGSRRTPLPPPSQLTADQLDTIRAAADRIAIVGARYPEQLDRLTNR